MLCVVMLNVAKNPFMLSVIMLNVANNPFYTECRYAECCGAVLFQSNKFNH